MPVRLSVCRRGGDTMRPVIGITTSTLKPKPEFPLTQVATTRAYSEAVMRAGGIPLLIPPLPEIAEMYLDAIDGLILSGGGDIAPWRYTTEPPHPQVYGLDETRDALEVALAQAAVARDMPLLAICRGMQVLAVALGGTLIQHIPDAIPSALEHRPEPLRVPLPRHEVQIAEGSRLAAVLETQRLSVNSGHHQAVRTVAEPLQVVAHAPDGVVEAIEVRKARFVVGVQWHPELLGDEAVHQRLFKQLVQAARGGRA
ncbi:putative glutamine amidotransferase [Ardenticatena maritima]|uniref:Putative glutamine amidotransferase n=2 Tax=Ardenticatena maritima TaxID=872965 RepID=A0A0M8KBT7_9CHLR|nr:putative glutamine amidotransferase [Ardenticatena maritima]